jgi:DNA-binding response OmpR family regulator
VIADGRGALGRLAATHLGLAGPAFDLVLLDAMLRARRLQVVDRMRLRQFHSGVMLTAKVCRAWSGLGRGADDPAQALTSGAGAGERLIRRRDWARGEGDGPGLETARVGDAVIDFRTFEVSARGGTVRLTLLEAMLLKLLVQNAGRIVSKAEILEKVWNVSADTETRAVDNFIMRLRRVLETNPRSEAPAIGARRRLSARPRTVTGAPAGYRHERSRGKGRSRHHRRARPRRAGTRWTARPPRPWPMRSGVRGGRGARSPSSGRPRRFCSGAD